MLIRTLGCSGGLVAGAHTTCFLLDEDTLIDAGTGAHALDLRQQQAIEHIFLTHEHLDHVVVLPFLMEGVFLYRQQRGMAPVRVYARAETIQEVHHSLFNGHIWPDFTVLPTPTQPVLQFVPLRPGQSVNLPRGRVVRAVEAAHSVPAVGYSLVCQRSAWVFSGDTGRNPALWQHLRDLQRSGVDVRHLVVEATFSNAQQALADLSGHLTPAALAQEMQAHLAPMPGMQIHLTHFKPEERDAIVQELSPLRALAAARQCALQTLRPGHSFTL